MDFLKFYALSESRSLVCNGVVQNHKPAFFKESKFLPVCLVNSDTFI
jgi:hypothetical protein